jgi:bis(5'-nucleosyl)-tetraphosphatase (symmetrical)
VRDLGDRVRVVLGNHDLHLIMQGDGFGRSSDEDTLAEILNATDRDELLAWLRAQPLFYRNDGYAMVHAGLLPCWTLDDAEALSEEVHGALVAENYREFLAHMWGSQPAAWNDDLKGWDRLRVVVNAMTRMRFCTPDGKMDFRSKGPPETAPDGAMPWFHVPGRRSSKCTVICGHWSALGFRQEANVIALDSGCLWGGALTAIRLDDRKVFQLPCPVQCKPGGWD